MSKRYLSVAAALYIGLFANVPSFAAAPAVAAPATAPTASSGDAAAKHAKRTACLKDAKVKKLVGAARTEFVKNCIAAP